MKRFLLFAGIGFIIITAIIVAITLINRRRGAQPKAKTTPPAEVVLTIWRYNDEETVFKDLIAEFLSEHPTVKIEYVKKDFANYENDALNVLATGQGPDIWSIPNDWLARHKDKLVPAPDKIFRTSREDRRNNLDIIKDRFVPIVSEEVVFDNKLYGLPLSVDTLALYINHAEITKIVNDKAAEGVELDEVLFTDGPQTWDELVKYVTILTVRNKDSVQRSVVALGTASNVIHGADILAAIMLQNRTEMISADGLNATFNLPAKKSTGETFNPGLQAYNFYTSFANPAKESFSWTPNFPNSHQAFLEGKTLMTFGYSDLKKTLAQINPEFKYRVVPFPQITGASKAVDFASYAVETVTNNAEDSATAWEFIRFITSSAVRDYLAITERPTPLKIADNPETIRDRIFVGSPFRFQAQSAAAWRRGKDPDAVESVFRQMIDDFVIKGINSEAALQSGANQITNILRQAAGFEPKSVEQ